MKRMMAGMCLLACVGAGADVVTNVWINPNGGSWFEKTPDSEPAYYTNWENGANCVSTNVGLMRLNGGKSVSVQKDEHAYFGGIVFAPADPLEGDPPEGTNAWHLASNGNGTFHLRTTTLGYCPISVNDGTLVLNSNLHLQPQDVNDWGPVRKEGNGTMRVSTFYTGNYACREFQIADGIVYPMVWNALLHADVRVIDPAGVLLPTNFISRVAMGSFQTVGGPVDFQGNEVLLGATGPEYYADAFRGTGAVTAVGRSLAVTNIRPNVIYGADSGRLRLDSQTGAAVPFAKYDFEESLTKDSSGHGRDLTAQGAVTHVQDDERGWVARFTGTSNSGGKPIATVTGTTELTGDSDYTISLWAKTDGAPVANNWPTLAAIGSEQKDHRLVQFRFVNKDCNTLLLGHWNGNGDFSDNALPAGFKANEWHHYIAMREGHRCSIWVDGVRIFTKESAALEMTLPETVQITLGWLPGSADRYFCGDIDDVRIYSRAVGLGGIKHLFAGEEPVQDGPLPAAGDPLTVPPDTKLRLASTGRIQLAGEQTLTATNILGFAPNGGLDMPAGGRLTLTGPGAYGAKFAGTAAFAKAGAETLKVTGSLSHTGGTTVEEGTLAVQNTATQPEAFAIYDFEDEEFGHEVTGSGRNIDSKNTSKCANVTRVWDAERQSWVARFPGTTSQKFTTTINSPVLTGNTDYTVSVWAKPAADCPDKGSFVSIGRQSNFQEIVFRYQASVSSGDLVLTHWGTTLDFTAIPTEADPQGRWHHFVATRKGTTYTVWYDGRQVWTTTKAQNLSISESGKVITIGHQLSQTTERFFKGDIDDVRIYTRALGSNDVQRLYARKDPAGAARGEGPNILANVPAPVLHYAFEDATKLGKDSAPGGNHLVKAGGGTLTQIDSPLGGKALKFDTYTQAYLKSSVFPEAIPSNGQPFTVTLWVQGGRNDTQTPVGQNKQNHSPTFVGWGNPTAGTIGFMLSYWHDIGAAGWSPRLYVRSPDTSKTLDANGTDMVFGMRESEDDVRWHHYAITYSPTYGVMTYIDGKMVDELSKRESFTSDSCREGGVFYIGAKSSAPTAIFRGAIDEVRVFDRLLNIPQICAVMRADMKNLRVLPDGGTVTVDAGATLEVNGTDERASTLTGDGTLDLAAGRLTLTGESTFAGTLAGDGTLSLATNAVLTLGANPTEFTGIFEMAGGTLNLPDGVTRVPASFRVKPIDTSATTACPGDVEIVDGTALTVTANARGPFVTSVGRVVVLGGGEVTLPTPKTTGVWVIGQGASAVDAGTGDLNARWRVTNLGANRKSRFELRDGRFTCTIYGEGSMLIVR